MKTVEKPLFLVTTLLLAVMCCFDSAQAQSTTLAANPSQLTFNTQTGVTTPAQNVLVTSAPGSVNVTVTTFSANNWLQATPAGGSTPLSLTVSIGPSAPTSGTDTGFISVTSPGTSISIPVILNVNSQGGVSPIALSPNSLSFAFPANSTIPVSQAVAVSSNNAGVTSFTASAFTNGTGNWLTVTPNSGSLPNTLQVAVSPSALPAGNGPFQGALSINAPGTTGVSLQVLVTVGGTPTIKVDPAQVAFAWQIGTTPPTPQPISIQSSTGANVSFTASAKTANCGNNWLVISQQTGATPATISVQVNTSGLSAGNCSGEVDISAPGALNSSVMVPVTLLVSTNPLLLVPSTGPTYNFQLGGSTPATQSVQIASSSTPFNVTIGVTPVSGGPNFLQLNPVSGATPLTLALALNPAVIATLGPGTYSDIVNVSSAGAGNSPQSFPVTLVVSVNAALTASVSSLNFFDQVGQAAPPSQTFTVSSTGAPLNFQVSTSTSTCPGFLSASTNGGSNGSTYGNQNLVVVSTNVIGLTPQVCSGSVTLTVPGSTSPPLVIPVSMNVSASSLLVLSPNAINVTTLIGAASTTQTVSVTSTDNTGQSFTSTAATNPPGLTWLSVAPNSGSTPSNLLVTINPANLAVGTYTGTINVAGGSGPPEAIPVTLVIVPSNVSANPTSLAFAQSLGAAQPASQSIQISGIPAGTTIGPVSTEFTASNVNWLSASSVTGGSTVTVTVNGSQLGIGTYSGVVTVIVPGAGNSPLNVPVTFTISAAASLGVSPGSVIFTYQSGSLTFPAAQSVQVTSSGGSVPFTAVYNPGSASATNLIGVTPASGNTPSAISLSVNLAVLAQLAPGTYAGTVVVSSASIPNGSQTINVTVTVNGAPPPVVISLDNAASLTPGSVSPGEIVTFFGTGMGPVTGVSYILVNGKLPTTLAGVTVSFNGVAAPLIYVSSSQINAIVPYEMAGQVAANVVVTYTNSSSTVFQAKITDTAPAIFSLSQNGNGQGAILNQNFSVNGASNPAQKGSVVQIFGTGEGQLVPGVATGSLTPGSPPFPMPIAKVSATIGGQPAQIQYAGEAPGLVSGLIQVNAFVPANIGSGPQTVVLTIGNNTNNQQIITVFVQ